MLSSVVLCFPETSSLENKKVTTVIHQHRKTLRALNEKKIQEKLDAVESAIEADERREKVWVRAHTWYQLALTQTAEFNPPPLSSIPL